SAPPGEVRSPRRSRRRGLLAGYGLAVVAARVGLELAAGGPAGVLRRVDVRVEVARVAPDRRHRGGARSDALLGDARARALPRRLRRRQEVDDDRAVRARRAPMNVRRDRECAQALDGHLVARLTVLELDGERARG